MIELYFYPGHFDSERAGSLLRKSGLEFTLYDLSDKSIKDKFIDGGMSLEQIPCLTDGEETYIGLAEIRRYISKPRVSNL